jgi:hypothetical protein
MEILCTNRVGRKELEGSQVSEAVFPKGELSKAGIFKVYKFLLRDQRRVPTLFARLLLAVA